MLASLKKASHTFLDSLELDLLLKIPYNIISYNPSFCFSPSFLNQCRPKSVSMGNAIKYLKMQINNIPQGMPDKEVRKSVIPFKILLERYFKVFTYCQGGMVDPCDEIMGTREFNSYWTK